MLSADGGSFKDPSGRVYWVEDGASQRRVVRGLTATTTATAESLLAEPFFGRMLADGDVVNTRVLCPDDPVAAAVMDRGWASALEHEAIEFPTWPYEWPFGMLEDAALLQLHLLERCVRAGWILKDATPFNIQWTGNKPVFIDIPSFVPREDGDYWHGYRQFCSLFLIPLMVTAHLRIPYQPLLRSCLEGIPPEVATRYFRGLQRLRKGVPSHVWFPSKVEGWMRTRDGAKRSPGSKRRQSETSLLALLDGLVRLVKGLSYRPAAPSVWSRYSETHSYTKSDLERKKAFVEKHTRARRPRLLWDLGANTGTYSRIAAKHSGMVIAVDGDHEAADVLYRETREGRERNIIPLVMDLANPSPGQGWAGRERAPFVERRSPDMALCLALVHHLRVSANVPVSLLVEWMRSLDATVIVEFVDRDDEMFAKLAENKREDHADYTLENFQSEVDKHFSVEERMGLKEGKRELLLLVPKRVNVS
ncbi:MAG: class I SAM-dependent methyltransferase [Gammaproteobacteria bacterium]|nr:class I SAM-dependent methyltransferase [Gammaproteobacteria bacterium]